MIAAGAEHFNTAGATAMVLDIPDDGYRLFAGGVSDCKDLVTTHAAWLDDASVPTVITHVDPRHPDAAEAIGALASGTDGFLVGGLTAAAPNPHRADGATGCLSGMALSARALTVATALSQGCTPIGKPHVITRCRGNVLIELDGEPALDVFKTEIGEVLASDLRQIGGVIFAAFPVEGSDTADYTVRNLVGIDIDQKIIGINETLSNGKPILFCRRDRKSAVEDMRRMTGVLQGRVGNRTIRGGLYISCAGRGPNQFEPTEREIDIIHETLGDFPVAGFFANGEVSRDRIYAYTGVLTLFL